MRGIDVHFVDVGQGASTVLIERRCGVNYASIVDCGRSGQERVLQTLLRGCVSYIDSIIISHNDRDHWGGLYRLASHFRKRIGRIFYVLDRDVSDCRCFHEIRMLYRRGWIVNQPIRVVVDNKPRAYAASGSDYKMCFLSPGGFESDVAGADGRPNDASIVVLVKVGDCKADEKNVLICGDATSNTFSAIAGKCKSPIKCVAVAVPHHGGAMIGGIDVKWLYGKFCVAENAIISVGRNQYGHPNCEVISTLVESGARVMCTQVTKACWRGDLLELRAAEGDRVPCAGTVVMSLPLVGRYAIASPSRHNEFVYQLGLSPFGCPLCRCGDGK